MQPAGGPAEERGGGCLGAAWDGAFALCGFLGLQGSRVALASSRVPPAPCPLPPLAPGARGPARRGGGRDREEGVGKGVIFVACPLTLSPHSPEMIAKLFDLEDYAGTYRETRNAYLKAANQLKLATGPYKAARDAYVAATATYTKSLYE
mmetsp:Transcript_9367/g.21880  ORF Transcript_9367/g.21880 Transcript_9367/m.21880 type:complete len:150 (+) Transcript_9367:102-551(+)